MYVFNYYSKLISRPFGYEWVYLPLHKVAATPFHIQGGGGEVYVNIAFYCKLYCGQSDASNYLLITFLQHYCTSGNIHEVLIFGLFTKFRIREFSFF